MNMEQKNAEQKKAAKEAMISWLSHPQELGKAPAKIECACEFELNGMRYYIFKYKKGLLGKWLLGVCGGYEGDELENCGHVFSEMEEYNESTAVEQATALVEQVRKFWIEQAESAEKQKESAGSFVGLVLLEKPEWNKEALLKELKEVWHIEDEPEENEPEDGELGAKSGESEGGEDKHSDDMFVIQYHGAMIAVSLMPGPVPDGEAEYHAEKNYTWREGAEVVKKHKAHLLVAVMGKALPAVESGKLFAKAAASCCKQPGVLGIYVNETVYQPQLYLDFAEMMGDDLFPLFNLVWFGLYNGKGGIGGYTCGMRQFGYDEIEVIDSSASPKEVSSFLSDIANYVITQNVILNDGETIGFSAEQKLPITKSRGVAVKGDSLKIGFPG